MNQILKEKIDLGRPAHIYATVVQDKKIGLVRIGSYDEIRHRYNQMACLIGAKAMRALSGSTRITAMGKPWGSWSDFYNSSAAPFSEAMVWSTACQPPSDLGDALGHNAFADRWPYGIADLPGMKHMCKSMAEIGNVFYGYDWNSSATTGRSFDASTVKRAQEALTELHRDGRTAYQEEDLLQFMALISSARALHLFHKVQSTY